MDFDFDESQKMLSTAARDFLATECPMSLVRQMEEDEKGYSPELWEKMAEMGWMGVAIPEEYGGMGQSCLDLAILLEEMGRVCLPGPFLPTVVLGGFTILEAGSEEQKEQLLPEIAEGKTFFTLALAEPNDQYTADSVEIEAKANQDGWLLSGTKLFVPDAHVAKYIICPARTAEGITLFLVDSQGPGVTCTALKTLASDKQFEVVFDKVKVSSQDMLGELGRGWDYIEKVMPKILASKCAEMLGGAERVFEMSVDYAKERVQFGRPIGSFQAVQHHCSNMAISLEALRYITYNVAWRISEGLPCDKEASIAKAYVSDAYQQIVWLAHAVHASIGFTMDHDLPIYYRRAKAAEVTFGDAYFHQEIVAQKT